MKRVALVAVLVTALLAAGAATAVADPQNVLGHSSASHAAGPTLGNDRQVQDQQVRQERKEFSGWFAGLLLHARV